MRGAIRRRRGRGDSNRRAAGRQPSSLTLRVGADDLSTNLQESWGRTFGVLRRPSRSKIFGWTR